MAKNKREDKRMKANSTLQKAREPGFWRDIWQQARLVFHLVRDPDVPFYLKLLPFAAFAYLLLPFDFIADLVPVIGQLDDVTALLVFSKVFIELAPPEVVARHMAAIRQQDGFVAAVMGESDDAATDDGVVDAIIIEADHKIVDHEA